MCQTVENNKKKKEKTNGSNKIEMLNISEHSEQPKVIQHIICKQSNQRKRIQIQATYG